MIKSIQAWVIAKGGWTHALVLVIVTLWGVYAKVPAFAALVNNAYAQCPVWVHQVGSAAIAIFLTYFSTNQTPPPQPPPAA